jgi:hypothetical protein
MMNNIARMPESVVAKRIADLQLGETGYINPSALWIKTDRSCFLDGGEYYHSKPYALHLMKVEHTSTGYVITLVNGDMFVASSTLPLGAREHQMIPVSEIKQ